MKKRILIFLIFALPTLLIISRLGEYAFSQTSGFSDLTITHLPYAEFIRTTLLKFGQIPLWNPGLFGGMPFSAHPLSGLWYPMGWLTILIQAPFGFNLAFSMHMVIAGLGMFLLLKKLKLGETAAIIGGLAFELTPKLFAHWAAGHVSLCFAYSLTPWLILAEIYSFERRSWKGVGLVAIPFSLIILADIRWGAYAGLAWIGYRAYELIRNEHSAKKIFDWVLKTLGVVMIACMLAAPFLFDFLEFTSLSTCASMTSADRSRFGLPLNHLLGMIYPDFGGYAEWVFYSGALSMILTVMLVFAKGGLRKAGYWIGLMVASLALAVGSNWFGNMPLFNLLRVSSRFLFLFNFAAAIILGIALNTILDPSEGGILFKSSSWLAATGMGGIAAILALVVWVGTKSLPMEMVWGSAAFFVSLVFLLLTKYVPIPRNLKITCITLLVVLDLGVAGNSQLRWVSATFVDNDKLRIAKIVAGVDPNNRVYSPDYQITQLAAERASVQMVSGIDPMQIGYFAGYFSEASRIRIEEYSVPLPPLNAEPISESNRGVVPDAIMMGWMNIGTMVTNEDFKDPQGWKLVSNVDSAYIYQNSFNRPRAWVQKKSSQIEAVISEATVTFYSPNKIALEAQGPGLLVLSEIFYPGWRVRVDGNPYPINQLDELLRSIELEPGQHDVVFSYWPKWLTIGFAAQLIGLIILAITQFRRRTS